MGLAIFMLFIVAIFLVVVALVVTGIIFIVFGIENKKKGGKGKLQTIGIVMLAIPIVCFLCIGGKTLWTNARIKCVADEWRYKSILIPRNSVMSSQDMLRSMLESVDDKDKDKIYREFSANINADSRFEENVNEFFDDIEKQGVDLNPDDFLKDYGKYVHLEVSNTVGYIYSAEVDGETYYCYVRICYLDPGDKKDVGLQQFIVCTKDKVNELNKIIEDGYNNIYFEVL